MDTVPADLSTDEGPPLGIPLRHFVVAVSFSLLGAPLGMLAAFGVGAPSTLAHVHLLVAGWVCVTIMGAMTQFVPVWSGVPLYSHRLAALQLPLAGTGVVGVAVAFVAGRPEWLPLAGVVLGTGLWMFVYNLGRTLGRARPLDVTERHFAVALASFAVVPLLGLALAVDYTHPFLTTDGLPRQRVLGAHVTLAVFGAVLSTVLGALYQLAPMFTGTAIEGVDARLQRTEAVAHPSGVLVLAVGWLLAATGLARVGATLLLVGLGAFAVVLARRLLANTVDPTPMLARYAVATVALVAWLGLAAPTWLAHPLRPGAVLGPAPAPHLLLFGFVGFVVLGTLYHVVPFLVWVHRYSPWLGLEPVPLVDDLYVSRLARGDFAALVLGATGLVLEGPLGLGGAVTAVAGVLSTAGLVVFALNVLLVLRRHAPGSLPGLLAGGTRADGSGEDAEVAP